MSEDYWDTMKLMEDHILPGENHLQKCFDRWDLYVEDGTANNTLKISQNRKCKSKAQHDGRIKKSP